MKEKAFEQRWIMATRGSNNKILAIIDDPNRRVAIQEHTLYVFKVHSENTEIVK